MTIKLVWIQFSKKIERGNNKELKKYLRRLDDSEIKDIEDFYTEYLEDAGVQTRAEIEEKVGTPRQLSLRILADYSLKDDGKESGGILPKTNIKTAWLIILALLATPATLIIGVALLGVLVAAIGVAFAVAVTIIALAGAAIFITLTSLYVGIFLLFTKLGVGLFYLGIGIVGIGALMVILPIICLIIVTVVKMVANFIRYIYRRFNKKGVR